jgi:hypothetical protein
MDWLDYLGKRFNIEPIIAKVKEVRETNRVFDLIVDNIPEEWKR